MIAPTGAGKTAIGELAIVNELIQRDGSDRKGPIAIFLVPLKAITSERIRIWKKRKGVKAVVATAETAIGIDDILASDVVISVPEKIDSITRSPDLNISQFFESIRVLVVDEVHLLDMDGRGDALEAVVTRFLTRTEKLPSIRIIALSATVPNFEDVAQWLRVPSTCIFRYGVEFRPVKLETHVLTYHEGESLEEDRLNQDKIVIEQIEALLGEEQQAVVFVNSRIGTEKLAQRMIIAWDKTGSHGNFVSAETIGLSQEVDSQSLSQVIFAGVGFHHAGLSRKDRGKVEFAFIEGYCRVLVSTTTLAWGVNLPADVVIIRDVEIYDSLKGKMLIGAIDLQQMLGRAGRPGYSRGIGHGYVIVPQEKLSAIQKLIAGESEINSRLLHNLKGHILAEIVRGVVLKVENAVVWLEHTYYYLTLKNANDQPNSILQRACSEVFNYLNTNGFISAMDGSFTASPFGELATRFYVRLDTATRFKSYLKTNNLLSPLFLALLLAYAEEFEGVTIRKDDMMFIEELEESILSKVNEGHPALNLGQKKVARMILSLILGESNLLRSETAIYSTILRLASFLKELSAIIFGSTLLPILEFIDSLKRNSFSDSLSGSTLQNLPEFHIELKGFPQVMTIGERCYGLIMLKELLPSNKDLEVRIFLSESLAFSGRVSFENGIWKFPLLLQASNTSSEISCRVELLNSKTARKIIVAEKVIHVNNKWDNQKRID